MILPANIDIIEENHKERGCFLEKAIAPKTKTLIFKLNCTTQTAFQIFFFVFKSLTSSRLTSILKLCRRVLMRVFFAINLITDKGKCILESDAKNVFEIIFLKIP